MPLRSRPHLAFLAAAALSAVVGCSNVNNPNVTGAREEAPETRGPTDPGKVNAGGPGVPAELRKSEAGHN